ncbi:glycosyltransferase [Devosia sp.]|uniref:glycosyltransferase n=1 Tax=Devosia sp. TaxID=1871048 RepID=UPI003BA9005F
MPKTIGLSMIVKNEAPVIERCLERVAPLVDYVLIADTGSSDDTVDRIEAFLLRHNIPGHVVQHAWANFAHNRTLALNEIQARPEIDYVFTIDADELLEIDTDLDLSAFKAGLSADLYEIEMGNGSLSYGRWALYSNRLPFSYKSVLHEYLDAPPGAVRGGRLAGMRVRYTYDGARSRNPDKFKDDARALEAALVSETDPMLVARYTFYLGQSYRDAGLRQPAYEAYLRRAEMGHWVEERYVSLVNAGSLAGALGKPLMEQVGLFLQAYDLVPGRAEALHGAARACRQAKHYHLGYLLARRGLEIARPDAGLFIDDSVYAYRMLDELQILAYWSGHFAESADAAATLLADGLVPEADRPRLAENARFAFAKAGLPQP